MDQCKASWSSGIYKHSISSSFSSSLLSSFLPALLSSVLLSSSPPLLLSSCVPLLLTSFSFLLLITFFYSVDQNREDLQQRLCHHNKAIAFHIPDWEIKLCLSKEIDGERVSQFRNGGIKIKILRNTLTDDLFLALYQQNEVLSILHTINKASQVPLCSLCSRKPCPCLAKLKSKQQDPHGLNEKSQEDQLSEEQGSSGLKRPIE